MMPVTKYTTAEEIDAMHRKISQALGNSGRRRSQRYKGQRKVHKGKLALKIAGWLLFSLTVLSLLAVLLSVNAAKSRGETPELWGFYLYRIESGSMDPTLPVGTVILARKPQDANKLQTGDIVTFQTPSAAIVTHRIIERLGDAEGKVNYRTKGDNPVSSPDPELLEPEWVMAVFLAKVPFI